MSLYSRLDRIAADVARLDRQLTSVSNHPQSQRTSVEGGSIDFNDDDGNLMAIVGSQDDGGNTINVISGPTPPTPVGFTVETDHGKFIVHWSGDFDGDKLAPSDWSRAEVHASQDPFFVPDRTTARGSIVSAAGGEVTIGVLKGPWTIKMLAWSQAGKMSAPSAPVDVEVPGYGDIVLEEIDAAETDIKNGNSILVNAQDTLGTKLDSAFGQLDSINDDLSDLGDAVSGAVESANGKNVVHYEDHAPTPADEGAEGDTWFVGQVGRPNDVVEATNMWLNPTFGSSISDFYVSGGDLTVETTERGRVLVMTKTVAGYVYTSPPSAYKYQVGSGKWVAASFWANTTGEIRHRWATYGASTQYVLGNYVPASGTRVIHSFQMPTGQTEALLTIQAQNKSGSTSVRAEVDDVIFAIADTEEKARSIVGHYFDGDTPSGATPNESHYRWTGTPHASTSEKYLPATEGLSDKWNVTEQYRFQSGEWVQVELSHTVLSSLDLGKLVAGSAAIKEAVIEKLFAEVVVQRMSVADEFIGENAILTGAVTAPKITASEELWAKLAQFVTVYAEMVDSDVFRGRVFTGNTYLQDDGSEWSGRGLFVVAPDGETLLNVPTNGEPVTINADNTAIRSASIDKLDAGDTSLTTGSTLTLEAGQQAYPSAPEIRADWYPSTTFDRPDVDGSYNWTGLAAWGNKWVRVINVRDRYAGEDREDYIVIYDEDGTVQNSISIDINPRHDVAVIGDVAYTVGPDRNPANSGKNWVHGFNLNTGARASRWEFTRFDASNQASLALGTNGTDLYVAGVHMTNDTIYVLRYNPTTGAQVGSDAIGPWGVKYTKALVGIYPQGNTVYICHQQNVRTYTLSGSTLTQTFGLGWGNPNQNAAGMDMTRGWPFIITESGNLFGGSVFTGDENTIEATITFRDSAGHETDASPVGEVLLPIRRSAAISIPQRPNLTTRVYYRLNAGTWQWYDLDETTKRFWVDFIPETREADPPTVNTFPNAEPSIIRAAAGQLEFRGDGSGRWGQLEVHADGTMDGIPNVAAGIVSISTDGTETPSGVAVTFPPGRFTSVPVVTVTANSTVVGNYVKGVGAATITETGFVAYASRVSTAATQVSWIATEEG